MGGAILADRLMSYVIVKTITDAGLKKAEANMALYATMGTDLALEKFGVTIATQDGYKILPGGIKSGVKAVFKKEATQIGAKAGESAGGVVDRCGNDNGRGVARRGDDRKHGGGDGRGGDGGRGSDHGGRDLGGGNGGREHCRDQSR